MRNPRQQRGIGTSTERDDYRPQLAKMAPQRNKVAHKLREAAETEDFFDWGNDTGIKGPEVGKPGGCFVEAHPMDAILQIVGRSAKQRYAPLEVVKPRGSCDQLQDSSSEATTACPMLVHES